MCLPELHDPGRGVGRRRLLKLGALAAGAAAAGLVGRLETRSAEARSAGAPLRQVSIDHLVDLTHVLSPSTPIWPGFPPLSLNRWSSHEAGGSYVNQVVVSEHHGTHLDAPIHFARGAWTTAEIPARTLVAPAVVLDLHERATQDADTVATPDDLLAWEREHGRVPPGAVVLLHTGWAARISDEAAFRNTGRDGWMHFPGFGQELAQLLVAERDIVGLGTDTLSADPGTSRDFVCHHTVQPANKWILEVLANLDQVPPAGAHLFVGAPKHAEGSGGPSRVLAVW